MDLLQFDNLDQQLLNQLELFTTLPMVVFNHEKLLFFNNTFINSIEEDEIDVVFHNVYHDIDNVNDYKRQEIKIKNKKGNVFYFDAVLKPVVYKQRQAIFAMLMDISDRKKYEQNVAQIAKLRALIIEISNSILDSQDLDDFFDFVLMTTLKALTKSTLGTILVLDGTHFKTAASYGYSDDIYQFKLPLEEAFIYKETDGKVDRIINIKDASKLSYYIPVTTSYGEQVYIHSSLSAPIYFQDELYGIISIDSLEKNAFDEDDIKSIEFISKSIEIAITNRLLYEEKAYLSRYDRITGLYNRHFFDEHIQMVIKRAQRYDESFHLVMLDLDDLKKINDVYSHVIGDKAIEKVAHTIKDFMRDSDVFARYGGDEFVGVLFYGNKEDVLAKLDHLNKQLKISPLKTDQGDIIVSVSFGVATFNVDGTTIDELIRHADDEMYVYKNTQKESVFV